MRNGRSLLTSVPFQLKRLCEKKQKLHNLLYNSDVIFVSFHLVVTDRRITREGCVRDLLPVFVQVGSFYQNHYFVSKLKKCEKIKKNLE